MEILFVQSKEECIDGVTVREYTLSLPHERAFIEHLGRDGKLEIFEFAKPFFRVTKPGSYLLKGVEGSTTLNVVYSRFQEHQEQDLVTHILAFSKGGEA